MKSKKVSFDFSDVPEIDEGLRIVSVNEGTTQKAIVIKALRAYFADKVESDLLLRLGGSSFVEWDNKEDGIYDSPKRSRI